jgi:acyl transferase domain-containing protein/tryptophanase/acyl carrier protein
MTNDDERLKDLAETHLKALILEVSGSGPMHVDSRAPFSELGVDSFRVLKIVKMLEADFGSLPKTLLFENFNISDLADYLLDKHRQVLASKLSARDPTANVQSPQKNAAPPPCESPAPRPEAPRPPSVKPILESEQVALRDPVLGEIVRELFDRYKNEAGASRGARDIAPRLFIGSARRGYFNYGRCKDIVLAYAYTGPLDYFSELAKEMLDHCTERGLQLNVFTDRVLEEVGTTRFSSTPFGVLQRVMGLQGFSLEGGAMRRLRYQVTRFAKVGDCRTEEYRCGTDPDVDRDIAAIIDRWCAGKTMVNPLIHTVREEILAGTLDARHRLFLTHVNGVLQNAILISPLSPEHHGYLMDLEFYGQDMPLGGLEFAIVKIIERLAGEGLEMFSLGGTYGCRLETCPSADPGIDRVLDELHRQNIFNDDGNLQFKNKFRPENRTVYLCRPANSGKADNIVDIIMMIADPAATQTQEEDAGSVGSTVALAVVPAPRDAKSASDGFTTASPLVTSRATILAAAGFNSLNIPCERVEIDLRTDSWAQLQMPSIDAQMKNLRAQLQRGARVEETLRGIFPFSHLLLTTSGRAAEGLVYEAWEKKGEVLQNLLFPTCLFHQIDKHFTPVELPCAQAFLPDSKELFKGNLALESIEKKLETGAQRIAFACVELSNNAVGGLPVSITHLMKLKALLTRHSIPLVMDATRVIENARFSIAHETAQAGDDIWRVVRDMVSLADVVICSLAKDFCVNGGGLIATNDRALYQRITELAAAGGALDAINRKLVALALQDRRRIETQVSRRMESVQLIWSALQERGVPVVGPAGGHCILLDVKRVSEFNDFELPVASFLAWLYLNTGIAAAAHNVGMQKSTTLNGLVRLAIPVGLRSGQIEEIVRRLIELFAAPREVPRLVSQGGAKIGDVHTNYALHPSQRNAFESLHRSPEIEVRATEASQTLPQSTEVTEATRQLASTQPPPQATAAAPALESDEAAPQSPDKNGYQVRDLAIIGMAGRYPGARNLRDLWSKLAQGADCISEIPRDRYDRGRHAGNDRYRGGFVDDVDRFDSLFFNISPREAELLDPQERFFLEVAWEAVEDAGYYPETLSPSGEPRNIGVFVGAVWAMYQMQGVDERHVGTDASPNSFFWSIANRVSYYMNLCGPSLTVDTACSSSLTALYMACEAIYKGDCSSAIVGGVNLDLHRRKTEINRSSGALSKEGVCRSFGKGGEGYVAGEGVGALLIKPLAEALRDGDNIHGVIKSAAVNHGGRCSGYMVPNPKAQAGLIAAALERAAVDARSIGYIEAHGTGTELGDPIEITGLVNAFGKYSVELQSCAIGSVKTNIGHLEAAAGVVGVCKVLLQMRHAMLAPSLHSAELNPFIDFGNSPFYVVQKLEVWKAKNIDGVTFPLRAGVSSFGAGGSNAHVILESHEFPDESHPEEETPTKHAFPLSARNEEQLRQMAGRLKEYIQESTHDAGSSVARDLRNIAHTLQTGRKSFEHKAVVFASTRDELVQRLANFVSGAPDHDVLRGSAKNGEVIAKLLSRHEQDELAEMLARGRDARKMAQSWADGLILEWHVTQDGKPRRKVSLPTYPFADRRHWYSNDARVSGGAPPLRGMHPLIDTNESTFDRQVFKKTFHIGDFFIADHQVGGIPTLPGVAYLEFARRAAEAAAGRKVRRIRNILWLSPIAVRNSVPLDVMIELKPNGEAVHFEVFSEGDRGAKVLHSQGQIFYATAQEVQSANEYIDLKSIRARCDVVIHGKEAYQIFDSMGLNLGPSFQVLGEVSRNDNETLGELRLPQPRQGDLQTLLLHPSLVDGSLQAGAAARLKDKAGEMVVPYSIGEVEILHPLIADCWSYVTVPLEGKQSNSRVSKANVLIVDGDGKILVRIRDTTGVPLREIHTRAPSQGVAASAETLYYTYAWLRAPSPLLSQTAKRRRSILFFDVDARMRDRYDERMAEAGKAVDGAVLVQGGEHYEELGDRTYRINRRVPEDFARLCAALRAKAFRFDEVCFSWSNDERRSADMESQVHELLYFCQALTNQALENKVRLLYLFRGDDGEHQPQHEAINGFAKALHIEHPKVFCKTLELRGTADDEVLGIVLAELDPELDDSPTVRYEALERHIRVLKQLDLSPIPEPGTGGVGLKERGVYLITGGAGGLGLIFAEYLAKQFHARLILTGRSKLDTPRLAKLEELKKLGAEVIYIRADVADRNQIESAAAEGRLLFGQINGIIHSAGVLRDSYIRTKSTEEMRAVCAPKIQGTLNLDEITQHDPLDFMVLFSSLSAVGGNPGQSDYCFANHFMDSFALRREAQRAQGSRTGKTLSLNWSLWAEGGMRLDPQSELLFKKATGIEPLRTATGLEAFSRALASNHSQIAVVAGDRAMLEVAWGLKKAVTPAAPAASTAPPDITASGELVELLRQQLIQFVVDLLKVDAGDVATDKVLLDLGFDSIGLATYANKINERYLLELTPILFFDYPSIDEIAKHLVGDKREQIAKVHLIAPTGAAGGSERTREHDAPGGQATGIKFGKGWDPVGAAHGSSPAIVLRTSAVADYRNEPIAIVGMSGVMPQSDDLQQFWEHLRDARHLVTEVPEDRWRWQDCFGDPFKEPNKTNSKWGAFMKEVDKFDPLFFGISAREAHMMDPQQRIFLQTVWKAIEDSGHKVSDLSGTKTGLFVGVATIDYVNLVNRLQIDIDAFTASGNSHSVLANRISFLLNLRGPSSPIDTACSSSLVALHRAIESIHTGSCDMAIVGGVQVMLTPAAHVAFSKAGRLSNDGKCRTFDKQGTGYVRGEGVGAIFIKRLSQAESDGDHIYAVVKATAENHGGRVTTLTAPNGAAQTELLMHAYEKAGIDPGTVGYIECHGTGSSLGDSIEVQALSRAFAELYKRQGRAAPAEPHCGLSSLKSNIGHLETAAGIAGIIKILLSIRHQQIPATLHLAELNPYINLKDTPFYIVDKTTSWEAPRDQNGAIAPRRAGISSFGFGGANAHIVLEEYIPARAPASDPVSVPRLVILSAKSEDRLKAYAQNLLNHVERHPVDLASLAYTLQMGRDAFAERLAFVITDRNDLIRKLKEFGGAEALPAGIYRNTPKSKQTRKPVEGSEATNAQELVAAATARGDLAWLAQLWVNGADVDWRWGYGSVFPVRIPLPSYPFAEERYWLPNQLGASGSEIGRQVAVQPADSRLHPLIHQNTSTFKQQKFAARFTGSEFFIADHAVDSRKVFPLSACMEMARAAGRIASGRELRVIRNLLWRTPLIVDEDGVDVEISLTSGWDGLKFAINTVVAGESTTHALGKLSYAAPTLVEVLDIQRIRGRCIREVAGGESFYANLTATGLQLGKSFQVARTLWTGNFESLAELQMPADLAKTAGEFWLHPALIDGSLHAALGAMRLGAVDIAPTERLSVAAVHMMHPLTEARYAHATWTVPAKHDDRSHLQVNLKLLDENGRVLVAVRGAYTNASVAGKRRWDKFRRRSVPKAPLARSMSEEVEWNK